MTTIWYCLTSAHILSCVGAKNLRRRRHRSGGPVCPKDGEGSLVHTTPTEWVDLTNRNIGESSSVVEAFGSEAREKKSSAIFKVIAIDQK